MNVSVFVSSIFDEINHFYSYSSLLYSSVCSNNDQLKELLTVNNTDIESLCSHPIDEVHSLVQNHTHCITVPHVQVAIK